MNLMLPNYHALAVLMLVLFALVLFSRDRIPLETSSLVVLALLAVGFYLFPFTGPDGSTLSPTEFFLGFGHQALVAHEDQHDRDEHQDGDEADGKPEPAPAIVVPDVCVGHVVAFRRRLPWSCRISP